MANVMAGKRALILGLANKWSIAYHIAEAFVREGAELVLTYQGERQKETVQELGSGLSASSRALQCDVTQPADLDHLVSVLQDKKLDAVVHSIAFANREDL